MPEADDMAELVHNHPVRGAVCAQRHFLSASAPSTDVWTAAVIYTQPFTQQETWQIGRKTFLKQLLTSYRFKQLNRIISKWLHKPLHFTYTVRRVHFYRETACNAMRGIARLFCPSVCLSAVCLSVKRVNCDITKETCAHILIPHERPFTLVFWQKWLVGRPHSTRNSGPNWPCWSENANFHSIFARSVSVVTTSKKVQLTLIGSPLRAFQWA